MVERNKSAGQKTAGPRQTIKAYNGFLASLVLLMLTVYGFTQWGV